MDFDISDEQQQLMEGARVFGEREVAPTVLERDKTGAWDPEIFKKMGAAGLLGAPFPEEYGGTGLGCVDTCLIKEAFGEGSRDAGVALAWGAHTILCGVPIWKLGSEEQRRRYLPGMCAGELVGGFCLSEAGSGSDAAGMKTRAVEEGRPLHLERLEDVDHERPRRRRFRRHRRHRAGREGLRHLHLPGAERLPGFKVGQHIDKLGVKTSTTAELLFEDCEVPEENLLGQENFGFVVTAKLILGWERSCLSRRVSAG
jgi:alkylation response protein AidB-like acyl-CoA dehydrogenase